MTHPSKSRASREEREAAIGNATVEGSFQETFAEGNELRFRIQTDQSFGGAALPDKVA